ncbi:hypothetical protein BSKO_05364 [Bryopsis sp. KO-2023]|nr:hypothetical protein BSKO_05364 [Bryopsis sp. KO-2023]
MDVLSCRLVTVAGRTYRVQGGGLVGDEFSSDNREGLSKAVGNEFADDFEFDESLVEKEDSGDYVTRISADSEVYGFVVGKGGKTKSQIEQETETAIKIPKQGSQETPEITIRGPSIPNVGSARLRVELILADNIAKKMDYNFFVSIPLCTPGVVARLKTFQEEILKKDNISTSGIEASIFQKPEHLHLTVLMLKLYSEEKRQIAFKTMKSAEKKIQELLNGEDLKVELRDLEYMNDDPSAMDVLFLEVKEKGGSSTLQQICAMLVEEFSEAKLTLAKDERDVRMHVTILNTRYRRASSSEKGGGAPPGRLPFDGRVLLAGHSNLDLGEVTVNEIHLSKRGEYDPKTRYFHCAEMIHAQR